jgi:hypothetical protein
MAATPTIPLNSILLLAPDITFEQSFLRVFMSKDYTSGIDTVIPCKTIDWQRGKERRCFAFRRRILDEGNGIRGTLRIYRNTFSVATSSVPATTGISVASFNLIKLPPLRKPPVYTKQSVQFNSLPSFSFIAIRQIVDNGLPSKLRQHSTALKWHPSVEATLYEEQAFKY